jgi:hypothetical protein
MVFPVFVENYTPREQRSRPTEANCPEGHKECRNSIVKPAKPHRSLPFVVTARSSGVAFFSAGSQAKAYSAALGRGPDEDTLLSVTSTTRPGEIDDCGA